MDLFYSIFICVGLSGGIIYILDKFKDFITDMLLIVFYKKVRKFVLNNLDIIPVDKIENAHGFYNRKCHLNAYNEFITKNGHLSDNIKIIVCVFMDKNQKDEMGIHFINYEVNNDRYYDCTFGCDAIISNDLYYIDTVTVDKEYYINMNQLLMQYKYWLIDKSIKNKLIRKIYYYLEDNYTII